MEKLRCWPGCLARILTGELRDHIITCKAVVMYEDGAYWSYEPPVLECKRIIARMGSMVVERRMPIEVFADFVLQPIVPPPGQDATLRDEPIIKLEPEETPA